MQDDVEPSTAAPTSRRLNASSWRVSAAARSRGLRFRRCRRAADRPAERVSSEQFAVAADDGEQVVEVVGHAARQPADRLHLLRLSQLIFAVLRFFVPVLQARVISLNACASTVPLRRHADVDAARPVAAGNLTGGRGKLPQRPVRRRLKRMPPPTASAKSERPRAAAGGGLHRRTAAWAPSSAAGPVGPRAALPSAPRRKDARTYSPSPTRWVADRGHRASTIGR